MLTGLAVASLANATLQAGDFAANLGSADLGEGEKLPFRVSATVRGGYDSNPLTNSGDVLRFSDTGEIVRDPVTGEILFEDEVEESWFTTASLELGKTFGGPRTQLDIAATAAITQYWDLTEDEWDPYLRLDLNLAHAVTPKFSITANAYVSYQSEPDFFNESNAVLNGRRSGNYFYTNARVSANYRWTPKFSTVTSYNFVNVMYDDAAPGSVEDRFENIFAQEFRYLLAPKTTLTAQYRLNVTTYDDDRGRDALGHFITAGVDQRFGPKFDATLRGGVQFRNQDDGTDRTSPYVEGKLDYQYRPDSTLGGFVRYGLENSSLPDASTENETFRIGLKLNHTFSQKLLGNASFYYQNSQFSGDNVDRTEDTFNVGLGLTYFLTKHVFVDANYTFSMIDSDQAFSSYDRHRASLGLGASF